MEMVNAIKNLERRGFVVKHFTEAVKAAEYLTSAIRGTTVGIGGSLTIDQLDVYNRLRDSNTVMWHWRDDAPETMDRAVGAQVYITSANAVAETGEIVNIDGRGNRVAASLYDKDTVYIVVGANKFRDTLEDAIHRAKNIAAPKNAQRLGVETPCAKTGDRCYDCRVPARICNALVILEGAVYGVGRTEVVIVDEELGL